MPRKKKDSADAAGSADVRSFFATATPLRNISNTVASPQPASSPPLRAGTAVRGLKFGQIHENGGARARGGGTTRLTQRDTSPLSDNGEEVQYSGICLCAVHRLSAV